MTTEHRRVVRPSA